MAEERPEHTQKPAEGAEEDVEAPGAEKVAGRDAAEETSAGERSAEHTQEPAEGADEDVEARGAERSGTGG